MNSLNYDRWLFLTILSISLKFNVDIEIKGGWIGDKLLRRPSIWIMIKLKKNGSVSWLKFEI